MCGICGIAARDGAPDRARLEAMSATHEQRPDRDKQAEQLQERAAVKLHPGTIRP